MWYSGPALFTGKKREMPKISLKGAKAHLLPKIYQAPFFLCSFRQALLAAVITWSHLHVVGSITSEVKIDLSSNKATDTLCSIE